jgi:hypothetical protein
MDSWLLDQAAIHWWGQQQRVQVGEGLQHLAWVAAGVAALLLVCWT